MKIQKERIAELKKHYPSLPDNLQVGGYLYLRGTSITSLPDNLQVGGYLGIQSAQDRIKQLKSKI